MHREGIRKYIPGGVRQVAMVSGAVARSPGGVAKLRRPSISAAGVRGAAIEVTRVADPVPVHKRVAPVQFRPPPLIITSGDQN